MSDEDNINLRMKLAGLELEHADLGKPVSDADREAYLKLWQDLKAAQ